MTHHKRESGHGGDTVSRQTGRASETLALDFHAAAAPIRTTDSLRGVSLDDAGDWDLHDVAPHRAIRARGVARIAPDSEASKPSGRSPAPPARPASGSRTAAVEGDLVAERDLKEIERDFADGLTSVQVVDVFTRRGIRFSEATFRKYVQQGLLPRSRRVGRKGKHQGSLGLYPASTIRRINVIKRLQAENYTIEEIQRQFLRFRDELELVERGLRGLFDGFNEELARPHFDPGVRKQLKKDLSDAQLAAEELLKQLSNIERRVVGPIERPPGGGAPGGAEDLL